MLINKFFRQQFYLPRKFKKDKLIFIHIPKCAGSSFMNAYLGYQLGHLSAADYFFHKPLFYKRATVFTICRNPVQRFVSAYEHLERLTLWQSPEIEMVRSKIQECGNDINAFILNLEKNSFILDYPWFRPQHHYVMVKGFVAVDKVFKQEDMDEDFTPIQRYLGIELPVTKKINVNPEKKDRQELTREAIRKLEEIYQKDFTLFGYY
jgi:hypothetical protein